MIDSIEEPYVEANIMTPNDYVGAMMELCQKKRGIFKDMHYLDEVRVQDHLRNSSIGNRF